MSCLGTFSRKIVLCRNYADSIPTLGNSLFPKCNLLSNLVAIGREFLEALCLFLVELLIVVIKLTLHCIVRRNRCDRVLDNINPSLAITIFILCVVERNNIVLEQSVDCSGIKLVLIALVLVSTLLGQCPSSAFTIALKPPAVKYRKVYNTIHLGLLA